MRSKVSEREENGTVDNHVVFYTHEGTLLSVQCVREVFSIQVQLLHCGNYASKVRIEWPRAWVGGKRIAQLRKSMSGMISSMTSFEWRCFGTKVHKSSWKVNYAIRNEVQFFPLKCMWSNENFCVRFNICNLDQIEYFLGSSIHIYYNNTSKDVCVDTEEEERMYFLLLLPSDVNSRSHSQ